MPSPRETLQQIWDAYKGETNAVGKYRHIAGLLGYGSDEIEAFLDAPAEAEAEAEEEALA